VADAFGGHDLNLTVFGRDIIHYQPILPDIFPEIFPAFFRRIV
jgi:hypothetical protein